MTDDIRFFCVVDGESSFNAFSVKIASTKTVGNLKDLIKTEKSPEFNDIDANELILWRVSIPDDDDNPILLNSLSEKKILRATTKLSKVFGSELPDETIHIIVQRPPAVEPRSSSSRSGKLSQPYFLSSSLFVIIVSLSN
ncbi:hypothetical protein BDF22DRAFT_657730 [Syncephalis plumigaleata]|nr:hypothetical protein BDF22DRAFT_657730 [Syncephalis plumigaleata]